MFNLSLYATCAAKRCFDAFTYGFLFCLPSERHIGWSWPESSADGACQRSGLLDEEGYDHVVRCWICALVDDSIVWVAFHVCLEMLHAPWPRIVSMLNITLVQRLP